MFLLLLLSLISPILAFDENTSDRIYFHTRVTCYSLRQELYNYEIVFVERDRVHGKPVYEDVTARRQGHILPGGETNFTAWGLITGGDQNKYYNIHARIQHNCERDGRSRVGTSPITTKCKVGAVGICHVWVDIHLAAEKAEVIKVEQSP